MALQANVGDSSRLSEQELRISHRVSIHDLQLRYGSIGEKAFLAPSHHCLQTGTSGGWQSLTTSYLAPATKLSIQSLIVRLCSVQKLAVGPLDTLRCGSYWLVDRW